jgi:hypothetical protein
LDRSYGTPRAPVEAALEAGRDVLFDIEWQGHRQLRGKLPGDVVGIHLLPPSLAELERRRQVLAELRAGSRPEEIDQARAIAQERRISLGAAVSLLAVRGMQAPILAGDDSTGLPAFDVPRDAPILTPEMVRAALDDE